MACVIAKPTFPPYSSANKKIESLLEIKKEKSYKAKDTAATNNNNYWSKILFNISRR